MDADNLVRMANRIGQFFEAMPDRPEALEGIALHIHRFWEPRMRRALRAHLADEAALAEHPVAPIVREALSTHPHVLESATASAG